MFEFVELNHEKKLHNTFYSRDIVPTSDHHTWEFVIVSNNENEPVKLSWNNDYFHAGEKGLLLWDKDLRQPINMSEHSQYTFKSPGRFSVFHGDKNYLKEKTYQHEFILHDPFPNPVTEIVNISFVVPDIQLRSHVTIELIDYTGQKSMTLAQGDFESGFHTVEWNVPDTMKEELPDGLYLLRLQSGNQSMYRKILILKR